MSSNARGLKRSWQHEEQSCQSPSKVLVSTANPHKRLRGVVPSPLAEASERSLFQSVANIQQISLQPGVLPGDPCGTDLGQQLHGVSTPHAAMQGLLQHEASTTVRRLLAASCEKHAPFLSTAACCASAHTAGYGQMNELLRQLHFERLHRLQHQQAYAGMQGALPGEVPHAGQQL